MGEVMLYISIYFEGVKKYIERINEDYNVIAEAFNCFYLKMKNKLLKNFNNFSKEGLSPVVIKNKFNYYSKMSYVERCLKAAETFCQ